MTSWQDVILQDFFRLREAGHRHALMDEIEKRYATEGTNIATIDKSHLPAINPEDATFIITHPDDIKTGNLLVEQGRLDEARDVYWRVLDRCKRKLAKDCGDAQASKDLKAFEFRISIIGERFLLSGGFGRALECTENNLAVMIQSNIRSGFRRQPAIRTNLHR